MHGEELVIGGNPAVALDIVRQHNERAAARRLSYQYLTEEQNRFVTISETLEQNPHQQVLNMTNLIIKPHRPGFVRD